MGPERKTHTRSGSHAFSVSSTRASMDLIEDATQHFSKNDEITAHVQRERWDAFFEPQYSFGAFIHESSQPIDNHGEHRKHLDRLIDDGNVHIKSPPPKPSKDFGGGGESLRLPTFTTPISDMPRDSETEARIKERLALLRKIRSVEVERTKQPNVVRWKSHIADKARKLRKRDSISSVPSSPDLEKSQEEEKVGYYSRSFLCFVFGFLFPPLWLLGAFYIVPLANTTQTAASRRVDHIWRRRSRIAFGMFIVVLMIVLVVVFVVKPGSIGWRQSRPHVVSMN